MNSLPVMPLGKGSSLASCPSCVTLLGLRRTIAMRGVRAYTFVEPPLDVTYDFRSASAADLKGLVHKYMSILGLDVAPEVKVKNNIGAKMLGSCAWTPGKPTTVLSVQKSVMADPVTLERIVAHEMAHHAVFLENIKALRDIVQERGPGAGPYVRAFLQDLRLSDPHEGHGDDWLRYVKMINAHMGSDFVTKTSDKSYVQDAETKPYFVLIARLPNGKYGFQIGVTLSTKMKQVISFAGQHYGAKLVRTTDARWQHGPRIGSSNWATSPDKQDEMQRLHAGA